MKTERPSPDEIWLEVARTVARRGTCLRLQVGAVVVDYHNQIVSTGYNGAPPGQPHCYDHGCFIEDGHCVRTVHAEVNALLQAGSRARGATLYVTHKPCIRCANIIGAARIGRVEYLKEYP